MKPVDRDSLETAMDQAGESILITDPRGIIEFANPAFLKLTGYSREELIGHSTRILKSGEHDAEFYRDLWDTITRGEVWTNRIQNRRKDGSGFTAEVSISPVRNADGVITHYIQILHDVTSYLELEKQVRQTEKMDALGTLAGGVAHDFNNMLTAFMGLSGLTRELVESRAPTAAITEKLDLIDSTAHQAKRLVAQILSFSRASSPEARKPVDLTEVANQSLSMLRSSFGSKVIIWSDTSRTPAWVVAESSELQQIFLNLITNSAQALSEDGGVIRVRVQPYRTGTSDAFFPPALPEGDYHHICVSDNGCGMTPTTIEKIFNPFYTTKPKGIGTGLGLSTIKRIVDTMGGGITVKSEPGAGTTFNIFLPRANLEAETPQDPAHAAKDSSRRPHGTSTPYRLLFIEDEATLLEVGKESFEAMGFVVSSYQDALAAERAFLRNPYQWDAVLTDLSMPGVNGLTLARTMNRKRGNLPIFLLTGSGKGLLMRLNPPPEIADIFIKPISYKEVAESMRARLRKTVGGAEKDLAV